MKEPEARFPLDGAPADLAERDEGRVDLRPDGGAAEADEKSGEKNHITI